MLNTVHKLIGVYTILLLSGWARTQGAVLDGYVETALRDNPTVQRQRLAENERLLGIELAAANRRPTVDLRSDYLLSAGGRRIAIPIGTLLNPLNQTVNQLAGTEGLPTGLDNVAERFIPSNFHDSRIELSLPLLQPLIAREEALRRTQATAAVAETEVLENQVRLQVRQLYYAYLQSLTGLEIIDSSRLVVEELLRVNESLVRNKKATRDVVYRTEAELAELDGEAAVLTEQRDVARAALNRLLARPPEAPLDRDTLLRAPPVGTTASDRPELRQLDAGITALTQQADLQSAAGLPTLGLRIQVGAQGFLDGGWSDHPYATLGVGLNWNLYDGRRRDLRTQQIRLRREQLSRQREDTERAIALEVYQADRRIQSESARLTAATARIRASREALRLVTRRYRNDQALLLEYLDARSQVTASELAYNLAYYRLLTARAARAAALGQS
jgi:outer membrane protein TolC